MKFNKPTLVTITAPTCAGKNYLLSRLLELGFTQIVSTTTRERREGEVDGVDYSFITREQSLAAEAAGEFAELVEFRGNRYGVTHAEMQNKVLADRPPVVILEPNGLKKYEKICIEKGWDIYKIFVTTPEQVRIKRLNERTKLDFYGLIKTFNAKHLDVFGVTVSHDRFTSVDQRDVLKVIETHTSRLLSITGDERLWQTQNTWDAIVPGDDINKAISFIKEGIVWRNSPKGVVTT